MGLENYRKTLFNRVAYGDGSSARTLIAPYKTPDRDILVQQRTAVSGRTLTPYRARIAGLEAMLTSICLPFFFLASTAWRQPRSCASHSSGLAEYA